MIDFTNSIKKNKAYAGANGSKIAVVYNGEQYMLKFPPFPTINKGISYTNSCISEYIGCKILSLSEYLFRKRYLGHIQAMEKQKSLLHARILQNPVLLFRILLL